jgi:transposase-like protein
MVFEHAREHPSQWAAMRSIAEKLGCTTEALRRWVRQAELARRADGAMGRTAQIGSTP